MLRDRSVAAAVNVEVKDLTFTPRGDSLEIVHQALVVATQRLGSHVHEDGSDRLSESGIFVPDRVGVVRAGLPGVLRDDLVTRCHSVGAMCRRDANTRAFVSCLTKAVQSTKYIPRPCYLPIFIRLPLIRMRALTRRLTRVEGRVSRRTSFTVTGSVIGPLCHLGVPYYRYMVCVCLRAASLSLRRSRQDADCHRDQTIYRPRPRFW